MGKKTVLAILAVFVSWAILDVVIHQVILSSSYQATARLWRPMEEMKLGLMYFVVFVAAAVFVLIYARFASEKSLTNALKYGLLFGLGAGISMAYGSYSVMPIPYHMALVWFLGTLVETVTGGLLVGLIVRE